MNRIEFIAAMKPMLQKGRHELEQATKELGDVVLLLPIADIAALISAAETQLKNPELPLLERAQLLAMINGFIGEQLARRECDLLEAENEGEPS